MVEILAEPALEIAAGAGVLEDEDGGALHSVGEDGGAGAAAQVEDVHAAAVGDDERAFGCGEGNQELAAGVLAVDEEGPARPMGTWTTPMQFSQLPLVMWG